MKRVGKCTHEGCPQRLPQWVLRYTELAPSLLWRDRWEWKTFNTYQSLGEIHPNALQSERSESPVVRDGRACGLHP